MKRHGNQLPVLLSKWAQNLHHDIQNSSIVN